MPDAISTLNLEENIIGSEEIKCEIIDVKLIDPGIFRSKYTSYFIKTIEKDWTVERKFEAFVELRNILLKTYPGYIIPPIISKTEKKFDKQDLSKRKYYLGKFLNDILAHPVLRTASIVFFFLSLTSEKEYESKSKPYTKVKPLKDVKDFHTLEGNAKIAYNPELVKYCYTLSQGNSKLKEYHKE